MKYTQNLLFTATALSALALAFFSYDLALPPSYRLPLLMIFTAISASIYGLPWGLVAAGVSALLAGLQTLDGLTLLASAVLASSIRASLRQAHHRTKVLVHSHRLIAEALEELPKLDNRQALLDSLPQRLVDLGSGGHTSLWLPKGSTLQLLRGIPPIGLQELPLQSAAGQALREGRPQYVPARQAPSFIGARGFGTLSELALPIFERGEVVAILNFSRNQPLLPEEVEGLARFAKAVGLQLDRLADLKTRRLLSDLSVELQKVDSLEEASRLALLLLLRELALEAGVVWQARGGRMWALAHRGWTSQAPWSLCKVGCPTARAYPGRCMPQGNPSSPTVTQRNRTPWTS